MISAHMMGLSRKRKHVDHQLGDEDLARSSPGGLFIHGAGSVPVWHGIICTCRVYSQRCCAASDLARRASEFHVEVMEEGDSFEVNVAVTSPSVELPCSAHVRHSETKPVSDTPLVLTSFYCIRTATESF